MRRLDKCALLLILLLSIVSCSGEHSGEELLKIKYSRAHIAPETEWYLLTFGANVLTVDTIIASEAGEISYKKNFSRDTLDLMLLLNDLGHLELPIFADGRDITFEVRDTLFSLDGARYSEELETWWQLIHQYEEDVPEVLLEHLRAIPDERLTSVLALDLLNRYPTSSCRAELRTILRSGVSSNYAFSELLGLSYWRQTHRNMEDHLTPNNLQVYGKKDSLFASRDLMGKAPLMLLAFESGHQITPEEIELGREFHLQLDTLKLPTYHALLFTDTLPSTWEVREKSKKGVSWRYFLVDSTGEASALANESRIAALPSYILTDTLRQVWREWHSRDSVLHFMKRLRE